MKPIEFATAHVWAMEQGAHSRMMQLILRQSDAADNDAPVAAAARSPRGVPPMRVENGVAIIPIHGVIAHRASHVATGMGRFGSSVDQIRTDLRMALASRDVSSIALDVDSPGGTVAGIDDLATEIRGARRVKRIVAHTDSIMASAAYWLASQADQVVASRSAVVGSVGVIAGMLDTHRALANRGLDPVIIKSAVAKGGVQANGAMSDGDRSDVQRRVDGYHRLFVEAIAAGRGIGVADAERLADGRIHLGEEALEHGFVDVVGTRDEALVGGASSRRRATGAHAVAANWMPGPGPSDAVAVERQRSVAIAEAADADQHQMVQSLVASGAGVGEAVAQLALDRQCKAADAMPSGPGKWNAQWDADRALRAEFRDDKAAWLAYAKADCAGAVGH